MQIPLTLWQRMNLEGIIRSERTKDGDDLVTLVDVWNKIKVPDSTRRQYEESPCAKCGVAKNFDMDRLVLAPATEIDIEKAEARKLEQLIGKWPGFNVNDTDWLFPLKAELSKVTSPTSATRSASTNSSAATPITAAAKRKG